MLIQFQNFPLVHPAVSAATLQPLGFLTSFWILLLIPIVPFFMLSVLITLEHAQLIPLWLTAGLGDRLFRANRGTLQTLTQKIYKYLIWTATRWGQNPQYLPWMGHTFFAGIKAVNQPYSEPTPVTQVPPYIASSQIVISSKIYKCSTLWLLYSVFRQHNYPNILDFKIHPPHNVNIQKPISLISSHTRL